ncbi:MAG: hypothetical protein L0H75_10580 [Nitrosospira sp.]|nr:hypothetical protein [Nitrosospira sp.]
MHIRSRTHRPVMALCAALAASLFAIAPPAFSDAAMWMIGPVSLTEISGSAGSRFTLGLPEGTHGVYGLWSAERNEKPCYVAAMRENVNNFQDDSVATQKLCGADATGGEMKVEFGDVEFAQRTFVHGLRVCTNKDNGQVKGFQIRGRVIDDNGQVSDLPARYPDPSGSSGASSLADLNAPVALHRKCDNWQKWVECPQGAIATAITAHFGPESNPRYLTGIALQCRTVSTTAEQK